MHPAYSVILFTTASGAGYGLLVWLAIAALLDLVPSERWLGVTGFGVAFALITAGLLSSTAHLGRPERAWRAFSQWRTSWLSREGVLAVFTYIPAGLLALAWVFAEDASGAFAAMAALTVVAAIATLYCTGMIYASLRTIRQWHQSLTAPIYIALGLASGAALLNLLLNAFGEAGTWTAWLVLVTMLAGAAMKWLYWRRIDEEPRDYTAEAATGLGALGKVRPLEPPHTQPNYVMREMGYHIGRKHALRLRRLALAFAFALPGLVTLLTFNPNTGMAIFGAAVAVLSTAAGLLIERWLFFAEAEHIVMLYYGADVA